MRLGRLVLALSAGLAVSACGTPDPLPSRAVLLDEYTRSTAVKNDRFTGTGSSEARLLFLRANYRLERLDSVVLGAFPCGDGKPPSPLPSDKRKGGFAASAREAAQPARGQPFVGGPRVRPRLGGLHGRTPQAIGRHRAHPVDLPWWLLGGNVTFVLVLTALFGSGAT
ncbi:hypothetical protein OG439_13410 [Amycolatopsis sp. NBC_01307]|uniref:hypothetical protein n=1 Tax=Amycolatopsis sp. NBC_01307 TaxID=2903561 RepID=UPI002E0E275C|nr:hypothetical protein OG439_13410 [Amycolatopsis sp. NBC_01307]